MRKSPIRTRFMRFVKIRQEDDCWEWIGFRDEDGYGIFRVQMHNYRAHVASYLLFNLNLKEFPYPEEKALGSPMGLHTCDRPWCVNPDHIYPGDAKQNAKDMVDRGRSTKGTKARLASMASKDGHVKLTEEKVIEIRARAARGEMQKVLATEYGVGRPQIHRIITYQRWKDI